MAIRTSSFILALWLLAAGCGARGATCPDPPCDQTECEAICFSVRGTLIENLGADPARVDCTDAIWVGDCEHCSEVLRREFEVQPEACP